MQIKVDPKLSIWETSPWLELIPYFYDFKKKEGPERSSNILKSMYYVFHVKSPIRDGFKSIDELKSDMEITVLDEIGFPWEDYIETRDELLKHARSMLEVELQKWENEIKRFEQFVSAWVWDVKTAKDRMVVLKGAPDIWQKYLTIKEKIATEETAVVNQGNYAKSLSEKAKSNSK